MDSYRTFSSSKDPAHLVCTRAQDLLWPSKRFRLARPQAVSLHHPLPTVPAVSLVLSIPGPALTLTLLTLLLNRDMKRSTSTTPIQRLPHTMRRGMLTTAAAATAALALLLRPTEALRVFSRTQHQGGGGHGRCRRGGPLQLRDGPQPHARYPRLRQRVRGRRRLRHRVRLSVRFGPLGGPIR